VTKKLLPKRVCVNKGWGMTLPYNPGLTGEVFVYHEELDGNNLKHPKFDVRTVKLLYVCQNKKGSLHFHKNKEEIFFCVKGSFEIKIVSKNAVVDYFKLEEGDSISIPPLTIHQIKGEGYINILLEVSTLDSPDDSYRIKKGD